MYHERERENITLTQWFIYAGGQGLCGEPLHGKSVGWRNDIILSTFKLIQS